MIALQFTNNDLARPDLNRIAAKNSLSTNLDDKRATTSVDQSRWSFSLGASEPTAPEKIQNRPEPPFSFSRD